MGETGLREDKRAPPALFEVPNCGAMNSPKGRRYVRPGEWARIVYR